MAGSEERVAVKPLRTMGLNILTRRHRPQLPPVGYLDHDKIRRDEDGYQDRMPAASQILPPPMPTASPAHQYPSGPPPPYSHPAPPTQYHHSTAASTTSSMRTPPESRRTSGDEKEAIKQTVRQSLPSISEALGVDNQPAYHSSLPSQTAPSAPLPPTRPALVSSPSPRSHRMEPPQHAPEHHAPAPAHYSQYRQDTPQHPSYPPVEAPRHSYSDSRPPMHAPATRSPPPHRPAQHASQYPPTTGRQSPAREQPPQHTSGAMGPPAVPYGYQPYPPRYAQPAPPPSATAGPLYQPSLNNAAPNAPSAAWKTENARYGGEERPYGDSVKRQLDMYDLEGALNDVRLYHSCPRLRCKANIINRSLKLAVSCPILHVVTETVSTRRCALDPRHLLYLASSRLKT
jgi:hypothetical protein